MNGVVSLWIYVPLSGYAYLPQVHVMEMDGHFHLLQKGCPVPSKSSTLDNFPGTTLNSACPDILGQATNKLPAEGVRVSGI